MNRVTSIDTCTVINVMHIGCFWLFRDLQYWVLTTMFVKLEFDRGHEESRAFFYSLIGSEKLTLMPLNIEDLVAMANLPKSRKASDAELSCFVLSQRIGCRVMTDDERAIRYARNHLGMDASTIMRLTDLLIEAYHCDRLGDSDLRRIQVTLEDNRFKVPFDLVAEAARQRWMSSGIRPGSSA